MALERAPANVTRAGTVSRADDYTVLADGAEVTSEAIAGYSRVGLDGPAVAPVPTGRTGRSARPLYDARAWFASIDWSEVPPPRADDAGVETDDGRTLTTEDEVLAWFSQADGRA